MRQDYISYIRSKVGQEKVFLNFSAGILKDDNGKILLQLRGDNKTWGLVGGMMELGENSVETLIREFHEETGIDIEPIHVLNIYTNAQVTFPNGDLFQTVGFLYEVKVVSSYNINDFSNDETLARCYFSRRNSTDTSV